MLRLRQVMIDSMARSDPSTAWHAVSLPVLRERLGDDRSFAAFVVDHPERPGALAALVAARWTTASAGRGTLAAPTGTSSASPPTPTPAAAATRGRA